jgi:hypothetical protein
MQFAVARPDVVRAISQRWLLKFWQRHRGEHRVPQWQSVDTEHLKSVSANLSLLDVKNGGGPARFLIRYHGDTIGQVYGSVDCRGKFLDEVMGQPPGAPPLAAYHRAVAGAAPVYTIHDICDRGGRAVQYERLLLPFARDGRRVDRVLAAFEFICADGGFDLKDLMVAQPAPPALRFSAAIEASATA